MLSIHLRRCAQHAGHAEPHDLMRACPLATQSAGVALSMLLEAEPPLPGIPERASLAEALSMLGPAGCASLKARQRSPSVFFCLPACGGLCPDLVWCA